MNYTVVIVYNTHNVRSETNQDGHFYFEDVNPGLAEFWVHTPNNYSKGMQHRILLTPPVIALEPVGFTKINFVMPTEEEHLASCEASGGDEN